jgi:hypothetical protein
MKAFMDSQKSAVFIPELVQAIADFKSYVRDFHHDGTNKLSGLGEMHLFKFYVEEDRIEVGLSCAIRCILYPHSSSPEFGF